MSLKNVHLLFITVCLGLSLYVAQWALAEFQRGGAVESLVWMGGTLGASVAFGGYGWRFQRRCRRLGL